MADPIDLTDATPELSYLDVQDYLGIDPAQMLQVAANERENNRFALDMVKAKQNQQLQAAKLVQDNAQFNREMKFKQMQEMFDQKKDLVAANLAQRKFEINSAYTKALTSQSKTTQKKMRKELDDIAIREERMKTYRGTKFKINGSEQDFDVIDIMYMKNSGVPVTFKPSSKVTDLLQDKKSGEVFAVMNDATTKTIPELQNADIKSLKQSVTNIQLDPGERAERTTRGRIRGSFTDPKYIESVKSRVDVDDLDYYAQSISDDPAQRALADEKIINEVIKDITGTTDDPVTYVPGKGFFTVKANPDGSVKRDKDGLPVLKKKMVAPIE